MGKRAGLRVKMAVSYVLVTAAAVVVVEAVGLAVVLPGLLSSSSSDDSALIVQLTARDFAAEITKLSVRLGRLPTASEYAMGERSPQPQGQVQAANDGERVRIPYTTTAPDDGRSPPLALLISNDGRVVASSYPARFPPGEPLREQDVSALPAEVVGQSADLAAKFRAAGKPGAAGRAKTPDGEVFWAAAPVLQFTTITGGERLEGPASISPLGFVYVQVPAGVELPRVPGPDKLSAWRDILPPLGAGLLVLLVAMPVGLVFGLLSTRTLIGRLRRLAASTAAVADGDYQHRVPVSGADEVTQLETSFNRMAERLSEAIAAERHVAGANARARIARELHDSISQDLFSMRLLAGGLRRALPAGSSLQRQVETLEATASATMHEMHALLLELRPIALTEAGLLPALHELCEAYRDRLGVAVEAELAPVELAPAVEHAVLRIVQEALTNAVKHARPTRITLRMSGENGHVAVTVADDGAGFDPARAGERHGMGLDVMRERVAELGGEFHIDSALGAGTMLRILLPRGWP
jgi:signal transduction histidine kinase